MLHVMARSLGQPVTTDLDLTNTQKRSQWENMSQISTWGVRITLFPISHLLESYLFLFLSSQFLCANLHFPTFWCIFVPYFGSTTTFYLKSRAEGVESEEGKCTISHFCPSSPLAFTGPALSPLASSLHFYTLPGQKWLKTSPADSTLWGHIKCNSSGILHLAPNAWEQKPQSS